MFLKEFGMPTLLWSVLHSMGYPAGKEPRYYWSKEQLGDQTLVYVEAVIPPRGADPNWGGWFFGSKGRTPWEGANRASFVVLWDIMESHLRCLLVPWLGCFLVVIPTLRCGISPRERPWREALMRDRAATMLL
jgi:hypothetical protein